MDFSSTLVTKQYWHQAVFDDCRSDESLFNKIVRHAFVTMGTEWDLMLIISTQSIEEYTTFFSQLQQKGFIEKVWGNTIVSSAEYHFDPISVPDPSQIEGGLKIASDYLRNQKGLERDSKAG